MRTPIHIPATLCECDICHYEWISTGKLPPDWCGNPECRSRQWDGVKKYVQSHKREIKLPHNPKGGRPKTITLLLHEDEQF